jgi:hypothetical protein
LDIFLTGRPEKKKKKKNSLKKIII